MVFWAEKTPRDCFNLKKLFAPLTNADQSYLTLHNTATNPTSRSGGATLVVDFYTALTLA